MSSRTVQFLVILRTYAIYVYLFIYGKMFEKKEDSVNERNFQLWAKEQTVTVKIVIWTILTNH